MKRTLRSILFLTMLLLAALHLSGCSKAPQEEIAGEELTGDQPRPVQIGLSFDSFVIERWTRDRDVFVSTARQLGAEVNVQNANGVVEEQIAQIQYFISKNVDVIVVVAIDADALGDVIAQAKAAGISVVCYDRLIRNAQTDLYISFDNEMVGTLMGEALRKALPEGGDIFAIYGSQSDYNVEQVIRGLNEALDGSGVKIVHSAYCRNWLAELAFDAVSEGLEEHAHVDGIMCGNDDLASQAIRALSEHRLAGRVAVVAQDAELSACQRIVEGTQEMTVFKPVDELAKKAAELSVQLGEGRDKAMTDEELRELTGGEVIFDGKGDVPYYRIEPIAVTKENLDEEIIESGFHRREDVYLNVLN